jgi:hypothetical protein
MEELTPMLHNEVEWLGELVEDVTEMIVLEDHIE